MSLQALTSTKYVALDNRCTSAFSDTNLHLRIPFHAANLTTAIDITSTCDEISTSVKSTNSTISNSDFRSFVLIIRITGYYAGIAVFFFSHHGFRTGK